ncbi:hypothetical protein [Paenibacillus kobensis]|uniref:hypothetical protein n=1 Tax=Paenibacillus kobensis TaxID=59841 RepID=UPI000FDBAE95|nr:hypothetical protein [Paenibacillus kobensis]
MKKVMLTIITVLILTNIYTYNLYYQSKNQTKELKKQEISEEVINQDSTGIDIIEFISLLALNKDAGTLNDWKVLSERENHFIDWQTTGVVDGKRSAKVLILINGKWIPRLEKNIEPTYWDLDLLGPRSGVNKFTLSIPINSQELNFDLATQLTQKSIHYEQIKGFNEVASSGNMGYEIEFPNKMPLWVNYSWSSGSAGTSITIDGYYNKSGLNEIDYN